MQRILTGIRPTGLLHLGHYCGVFENRIDFMNQNETFFMVADMQALSVYFDNPKKIKDNVLNIVKGAIAIGLNPEKVNIFIQSHVHQLSELTAYYSNLISVQKLAHNPTVKTEMAQYAFGKSTPLGFYMHPVSQAADITAFDADLVPVGEDQDPLIEETRDIVRKFNQVYGETIKLPKLYQDKVTRLVGTDGNAKMSKSIGNCIYMNEPTESLKEKVKHMKTDPNRIHVTDPGKIEDNPVFIYHEAFNRDNDEVKDLEERYQKGTVSDREVKDKLFVVLENLIAPIRERFYQIEKKEDYIKEIIRNSDQKAIETAEIMMEKVRSAIGINI